MSEFLGLSFTKPADWEYLTDEQIGELIGEVSVYMKDPEAFEKVGEGSLTDFYTQSVNSDSVNVCFEKGGAFTKFDPGIEASVKSL